MLSRNCVSGWTMQRLQKKWRNQLLNLFPLFKGTSWTFLSIKRTIKEWETRTTYKSMSGLWKIKNHRIVPLWGTKGMVSWSRNRTWSSRYGYGHWDAEGGCKFIYPKLRLQGECNWHSPCIILLIIFKTPTNWTSRGRMSICVRGEND